MIRENKLLWPFSIPSSWKGTDLRPMFASLAVATGAVAVDWGFTYVQADIFDALKAQSATQFWTAMAFVPLVLLLEGLFMGAAPVVQARWSNSIRSKEMLEDAPAALRSALLLASTSSDSQGKQDLVQTLVEDTKTFAQTTVSLGVGLIRSLLFIVLFGFTLGAAFPVAHLAGVMIPLPMVLFAIMTFAVTSSLVHLLSKRLPQAEDEIATSEASLRRTMSRVREFARSIAMLQGQKWEAMSLVNATRKANTANSAASVIRGRLQAVAGILGPTDLFAILVLSPVYFSGGISLGQLIQVTAAHRALGAGLNWFFTRQAELAKWSAAKSRIESFRRDVQSFPAAAVDRRVSRCLELHNLQVWRPNSDWRLQVPEIKLEPGAALILKAPSGYGKSTLLAAVAGAWPWASGAISAPLQIQFVPQSAYFPVAALTEALAYPVEAEFDDDEVRALLESVGLGQLWAGRHDIKDWNATLSGGEAARLSLVRALLKKPEILLLDEPTAGLDQVSAKSYWSLLNDHPEIGILLITHTAHGLQRARIATIDLHEGEASEIRSNASMLAG